LGKEVKEGGNDGLQVAAKGERMKERISIAAWIVHGLVIVDCPIKTAVKFPFGNKLSRTCFNYWQIILWSLTDRWVKQNKVKESDL
jgi:hypothetical protein